MAILVYRHNPRSSSSRWFWAHPLSWCSLINWLYLFVIIRTSLIGQQKETNSDSAHALGVQRQPCLATLPLVWGQATDDIEQLNSSATSNIYWPDYNIHTSVMTGFRETPFQESWPVCGQGEAGEKPGLHRVARERGCVQFLRYRIRTKLLCEERRERRESTGYIQSCKIMNRTKIELDNQRSIWNSMETKR